MSLSDQKQTGIVFNIQHYSVHDGPGIRTVVFLTGCPLRCRWCSNPESQRSGPQLAYNRDKCLSFEHCIRCMEVCSAGAIQKGADNKATIDFEICTNCLLCADICPPTAIRVYGEEKSVKAVIDSVEGDSIFYSRSGGGLTLSGGEPLHQPAFAIALLREARRRRIHTAMETCGHCKTEDLLEAGAYLNHVLYDIKTMDAEVHRAGTGVSNEHLLSNFLALRDAWPKLPIRVRTPIVPGVNDSVEAIRAILEYIKEVPNLTYEMLPYHRMGSPKYGYLGSCFPMGDVKLDEAVMPALEKLLDADYAHLRPRSTRKN
ncbi:MAG: glycyl-radical enzyme activating protein [Desulfosarcinaceae bacterium]|nr:glycyl-radical enzyme activating protein [Desulfosarcinaceae bacterium]